MVLAFFLRCVMNNFAVEMMLHFTIVFVGYMVFKNKLIQILVMFNFVLTISGDIQNMKPVQSGWAERGGVFYRNAFRLSVYLSVIPSVSNTFIAPPYLLNPLNDFH